MKQNLQPSIFKRKALQAQKRAEVVKPAVIAQLPNSVIGHTGSLLLLPIEAMAGGLGGMIGGRVGGRARGRVGGRARGKVGGRAGARLGGRVGARGVCMTQPRTALLLLLSVVDGCWDLAIIDNAAMTGKGLRCGKGKHSI